MKYLILAVFSLSMGLSSAQALKVTKIEVSEVKQELDVKKDEKGTETLGFGDFVGGLFGVVKGAIGIYTENVAPAVSAVAGVAGDLGFEACKAAGCYKDAATEARERARVDAGVATFQAGLTLDPNKIKADYAKNFGGK